ncbi:hypothetical protein O9992_13510 [Vibrio lentus]|nr:hypothetical protein [Vibrio lentus]
MDGVTSPIKADKSWAETTFNGEPALRETDTFRYVHGIFVVLRTLLFYSQRYSRSRESKLLVASCDQYVGGIEHACMHLLPLASSTSFFVMRVT